MYKKIFFSLLIACTTIIPTLSAHALSFDPKDGDKTKLIKSSLTSDISLGSQQPTLIALRLINAALSLLAAICVGLLLYAGFMWIWARGNAEEVTKAKDIIKGTIIGLIIVLASLGITQFVFTSVADITGAVVNTQ